jgi:hypothetical protein
MHNLSRAISILAHAMNPNVGEEKTRSENTLDSASRSTTSASIRSRSGGTFYTSRFAATNCEQRAGLVPPELSNGATTLRWEIYAIQNIRRAA